MTKTGGFVKGVGIPDAWRQTRSPGAAGPGLGTEARAAGAASASLTEAQARRGPGAEPEELRKAALNLTVYYARRRAAETLKRRKEARA